MIKINANNPQLAAHLLQTVFAILRNEGLKPVDCIALVHEQLADGLDSSPGENAALHAYLQQVVAAFNSDNEQHKGDVK